MKTVKAWVDKWKEQFGTARDSDDVLLILQSENDGDLYEGHFLDTPDKFYPCKVIQNSRCIASSDKRRDGAYILTIIPTNDMLDELFELLKNASGDITTGKSGCGKAFIASAHDILKTKEVRRIEYVSKAVAQRILNLCSEYGYTVNHLSELSGITQSTVSDIVNGKSKNVGVVTLQKLCEGLGITIEEFFTDPLFREYIPY